MQSTSLAVITAFSSTLQKSAIFALIFALERAVGAAEQDVGLDAEAGELLHAVLRRLGLHLAGGGDERHQREVDVEDVLAAAVPAELADGFEERQALDVADRAADLADERRRSPRRRRGCGALISSVMCGITCTVPPR